MDFFIGILLAFLVGAVIVDEMANQGALIRFFLEDHLQIALTTIAAAVRGSYQDHTVHLAAHSAIAKQPLGQRHGARSAHVRCHPRARNRDVDGSGSHGVQARGAKYGELKLYSTLPLRWIGTILALVLMLGGLSWHFRASWLPSSLLSVWHGDEFGAGIIIACLGAIILCVNALIE